jgi:hypothetical protein
MFPRKRSANIGRHNRGLAADAGEARLYTVALEKKRVLPSQTLFRLFFPDPSLFPRCSNRGIVLAFEHEQRIRALIKAFADEKDP